ncbi:glutaredoxin family protein [Bacillus sp. FJAT-45350]|uniref:glutaredoxin family protein n=1 Tax=Bacillus sp. FJAT-45350 TaxID=2011014 RepID=UPI000BB8DFDB|nr:glutaredoxin family protein [Bacillus sp. FJAT-45350]
MLTVTFYSKENCCLCDEGLDIVEELQEEYPLTINVVDIYKDDALLEKYQIMIPVVEVDGEEVDFGILSKEKIRKRLLSLIG